MSKNANNANLQPEKSDSYNKGGEEHSRLPKFNTEQKFRRIATVVGVILLCITGALIAGVITQKRQIDALRSESVQLHKKIETKREDVALLREQIDTEREEVSLLSKRIDEILEVNKASGLLIFPYAAEMEDAFAKGDYERATRMAENLVFAYPSDAASYRRLLSAYENAITKSLNANEALFATRLVSWMAGIQDRQPMVLKSEKGLELYLSALNRQQSLKDDVIELSNFQIEVLRGYLYDAAADWNSAAYDNIASEATDLILVGMILDEEQLAAQSSEFIDAIELLRIPIPSTEANADELLDYLWHLKIGGPEEEATSQSIQAIIAPRVQMVSDLLAESTDILIQSDEGRFWLLQKLDDIRLFAATSDNLLQSAMQKVKPALNRYLENETDKTIAEYRTGRLNDESFVNQITIHARNLELLDVPSEEIANLLQKMEQTKAERHDRLVSDRVSVMTDNLQKGNVEIETILAELALLPQPTTIPTMSALIGLSQSVQKAVADRDRQSVEKKVADEMENAFAKGDYERATRMAENLAFVYPSDAALYQRLLTAYEKAIMNSLNTGQLLDATRLIGWMDGIQDRQSMVVKGERGLELYLSALNRQQFLKNDVVNQAYSQVEALREYLYDVASDWNNVAYDDITSEAAGLVLIGTILDQEQLAAQSSEFIDASELLRIPVPSTEANADELLDYLWHLKIESPEQEVVSKSIQAIISPRIQMVSALLAKSVDTLIQSDEGRLWLLQRLDEIRLLAIASDNLLQPAILKVEAELKKYLQKGLEQAIVEYRAGRLSDENLVNQVTFHARNLERLEIPSEDIVEFLQEMEQAKAERHDRVIADRISAMSNELKKRNVDIETILVELALLPQPTTVATMSALIGLSQSVQQVTANRDRQSADQKIKDYNRRALNELNQLKVAMDRASRSERIQTRIRAAKSLSSINESLLTRAMRDFYTEVYAEAMKGLSEEQRLEVYRHWVTATPWTLEDTR